MRFPGAWGTAVLAMVLWAGSLWGQMVYAPNWQRVSGNGNTTVNRTDIDQRTVYEQNLNVWNDNRRETNILLLPESAWPRCRVLLRQTVTLRGDFTEWRERFGRHAVVFRRRGGEISGFVVRNAERLDAAATQFFSFTTTAMMTGQVQFGQRFFYEQDAYHVHAQLGAIEAYGANLMSMSFHVLVLEDEDYAGVEQEFEATSLVWERGVESIDTPVGVFHLSAGNDRREIRIERYEHARSTREPELVESLSAERLAEAVENGRCVEYSAKGYTLQIAFTEVDFDPDDGTIQSIHATLYKAAQ